MNVVILDNKELAWLGKYAYTIIVNDELNYQVLGVDDKPLGKPALTMPSAIKNAMKEYDTSFVDMIDETV